MNQSTNSQRGKNGNQRGRRLRGAAVVVVILLVALVVAQRLVKPHGVEVGPLYRVERGPLTISVVTSGTIQSKRTSVVRSQAEGRNTVIWIIDEGQHVTNNQPLVELDASTFSDRLTDQQVIVGNAEASLIASGEKLEIARIEQRSSVAAAELKLHLARLEQEKYLEGEFPQTLQEQESRIALAQEEVERAVENLSWTRRLADEGYLTRSELQADEMALKQKHSSLQAAVTSLNVLTNFSARQQQASLASNVQQAEMELERVQRQTRANVVQAESDFRARQMEVDRQRSRLANLERQIEACHIVAPTNGVVIYHSTMQASRRRWGGEPLQAGSTVVERQELIHIPVEGGMIVEFSVPESNMTKLKLDQAARVKVEAVPGSEYAGHLSRIGLLPDGRNAWLNPDLQLYNCEVELDSYDQLRAGMNCEVEMQIEHHEQALFVPIQSVIRVGAEPVVYLMTAGKLQQRPIKVGLDNGRMIHVLEGVAEGEQVSLNPPLEAGTLQESDMQATDEVASAAQPLATAAAGVAAGEAQEPAARQREGGRRGEGGAGRRADAQEGRTPRPQATSAAGAQPAP